MELLKRHLRFLLASINIILLVTFSNISANNSKLTSMRFLEALQYHDVRTSKPFLWVYWENIGGATKMPTYITLCRETLRKHCKDSFNIVELDDKNIYDYLPELKTYEDNLKLNSLKIIHKVDYLRVMLLYKFGGIYLDSDIIVMKDLKEITDKLKDYDYVGFERYISRKKQTLITNWAMVSRPRGMFIATMLKEMIERLLSDKNLKWNAIGRDIINPTLLELQKKGHKHFRYSQDLSGTRDIDGKSVETKKMFSSEKIHFKDINKLLIVTLFNTEIKKYFPEKFKQLEQDIFSEDTNFSFLVKKSLSIE